GPGTTRVGQNETDRVARMSEPVKRINPLVERAKAVFIAGTGVGVWPRRETRTGVRPRDAPDRPTGGIYIHCNRPAVAQRVDVPAVGERGERYGCERGACQVHDDVLIRSREPADSGIPCGQVEANSVCLN